MNFQVSLFDLVWMFWAVIAAMLAIAVPGALDGPQPRLDLAAVANPAPGVR